MHPRPGVILAGLLSLAFSCAPLQADVILSGDSDFGVDVSPLHGGIAIDLAGSIWTMAPDGGQARQLTDGLVPAAAPRWSPDGTSILYQVRAPGGSQIWMLDVATANTSRTSESQYHDQDASWHTQGDRIVFASERHDTGLDIWETDLPTGLSWRVTHDAGDDTEPTWSRNGRHLAYIRKLDNQFTLVLRRLGESEQILVVSDSPLSSPSWRPDGSLLTYLRHGETGTSLEMVILSDPPIYRVFAVDEEYVSAPVSWRDRSQMVYAADGSIKTRGFEERRSRRLSFRAAVQNVEPPARKKIRERTLLVSNPPKGRLVVRSARLFDGIWQGYREKMDVLIDGGKIVAVAPRQDWIDATVIDLGNVTVVPGLIDAWSGSPGALSDGPALLAYGVTAIVTGSVDNTFDRSAWEGEDMPGPRVLQAATITASTVAEDATDYFLVNVSPVIASAADQDQVVAEWRKRDVPVVVDNWAAGRRLGADILLGADALPIAARHLDHDATGQQNEINGPTLLISGLADAGTPGVDGLLTSRQAREFAQTMRPGRRIAAPPQLATTPARIAAGSAPNGLPAGLGLHAELLALRAAGLNPEQTLHAAGKEAASMLGVENQIGTITPGAMADLVLVNGDPLNNLEDLLKIIAVVRNGRFFSLVSLLERAKSADNVE